VLVDGNQASPPCAYLPGEGRGCWWERAAPVAETRPPLTPATRRSPPCLRTNNPSSSPPPALVANETRCSPGAGRCSIAPARGWWTGSSFWWASCTAATTSSRRVRSEGSDSLSPGPPPPRPHVACAPGGFQAAVLGAQAVLPRRAQLRVARTHAGPLSRRRRVPLGVVAAGRGGGRRRRRAARGRRRGAGSGGAGRGRQGGRGRRRRSCRGDRRRRGRGRGGSRRRCTGRRLGFAAGLAGGPASLTGQGSRVGGRRARRPLAAGRGGARHSTARTRVALSRLCASRVSFPLPWSACQPQLCSSPESPRPAHTAPLPSSESAAGA
jgi:hypothetical protein